MKKGFIILAGIFFAVIQSMIHSTASSIEAPPVITSGTAILMDAQTGRILFEKDAKARKYPASITKIMTCLLALENASMDETVTLSHEAVYGIEFGSSHIALREGERISMESALHGLMLSSANDAAVGIAEHVGGSIQNFGKMMTSKAKDLGCINTRFTNPHGLFQKSHYTSAYDMALITKKALEFDEFRKICGTLKYTIPKSNMVNETRPQYNIHKMSEGRRYEYKGFEGGKTGFTTQTGNTLVTFAKRGNLELICVVLETSNPQHYKDTIALMNYGFRNYQLKQVSPAENCSEIVSVTDLSNKKLTEFQLEYEKDLFAVLPRNADLSRAEVKLDIPENILLPSEEGQPIGKANVYYLDELISSVDVVIKDGQLNQYLELAEQQRIERKDNKKTILLTAVVIFSISAIAGGAAFIIKFTGRREEF